MKKIISILLSALLIIASLSGITTVCSAATDDTVHVGEQITVTYSFAKDIPVGCMDYLFRAKYPVDYVKYKSFKNHWVSYPMVSTNEDEYKDVTASASALSSSEVKAGDKIISFIFDVTKETKLSNLDFSLNELQMYDNDKVNHSGDLSYLTYDVEITSRGEQTTEPTTVQPTTKEPTPATGTVYPGDQITITYSFAKDIPAGCPCYLFRTNYPFEMVKYNSFKNHWVLWPMVATDTEDYKDVSVSAFTAYGPEVKAGEKIISLVYDVIKETKLSDLDFSFTELQLYDNKENDYSNDYSYLSYDIEIEKSSEPTTVAPTTTEPTTVAPTTEEPTTVEPTMAKLKTVKGTVKSYLSEGDTVTIQLIKSGEVAYETTVKGNNAKYSISGVASGTYTMKVSKNAHADREYTVIVANSDVIRNAKIFAIGDVNSDGDISVVDATLVQKYIVGLENLTDLQKKSADVNDNNEISVVDATLIQKYIVGLDNFA